MPSNKATIRDIANILNIHHSTVSRALNNSSAISESTKKKVKEVAANLNYSPNHSARALKTRKSNIIGIIVPDIRTNFFGTVLSGAEDVLYDRGYILMAAQSYESYEREAQNVKAFSSHNIGGVMISISQKTTNSEHFKVLQQNNIPLVFFDRYRTDIPADIVKIDDYEGARIAVKHLLSKGRRKIAHLAGPKELIISQERLRGYKAALSEANIEYIPDLVVHCGFYQKSGREGVKVLFERNQTPDAIFAVNDPVGVGACSELKIKRIQIPDEIAVVGFGNTDPDSILYDPPLTTIDQHTYEMGRIAAHMMLNSIENLELKNTVTTEVIKPTLIPKGST